MLKTAFIFKTFYATLGGGGSNYGIMLEPKNPVSVKIKCDNFATQAQIYNPDESIDIFEYKYITFDERAIFEITDCVKNDKYTTIFIQYLSNVKLNDVDTNFRVKAQTIERLQELGMDLSEFMQILGNGFSASVANVSDDSTEPPFIYAIKIRLSEIPQNLKYAPNGSTMNYRQGKVYDKTRGNASNMIYNPSRNDYYVGKTPSKFTDFKTFDNAVTAYVPIPNRQKIRMIFGANDPPSGITQAWTNSQSSVAYDFQQILNTLDALITDLTLSAEITIIDSYSIIMLDHEYLKPIKITQNATETIITAITDYRAQYQDENSVLKWIRFVGTDDTEITKNVPVFLLEADHYSGADTYDWYMGFWESLNYIPVNLRTMFPAVFNEPEKTVVFSLLMLGNKIDLSYPEFYNSFGIKRETGFLRVWIDLSRDLYTDISTTFEFAKNAYSNYDAYKAANVDLLNRQAKDTLELQQKQQRELQNLTTAKNIVNTVGDSIKSSVSGFQSGGAGGAIAGGVSSLATGVFNTIMDEYEFNTKQQNAVANQKLAAEQAHERARATIVPSTEMRGAISPQTFLAVDEYNNKTILFEFIYARPTEQNSGATALPLYRYVFENAITHDLQYSYPAGFQIKHPAWLNNSMPYQIKIISVDPASTRKDFTVFVEDKTT